MKASHTPAPWRLTSTPNRPLVIADSYDVAICDVSYASHPQECEANARLISAAPELLETAAELLRAYDTQYGKLIAGSTAFADAYLALHNAIAKATQP